VTIAIDQAAVTMILLHTGGWENIQTGSLQIDVLEDALQGPMQASGELLYGFSCVHDSGVTITGRLTALLAVKEAK